MRKQIISILLASSLCAVSMTASAASYTVQKGDSYYAIAARYGVSFQTLLKNNGATTSSGLNIGDVIDVPVSGTFYTAQKGDSYYSIAQTKGVGFQALLNANGATVSSMLSIGQQVYIPSSTSTSTSTSSGAYVTYITYTVKSGDNLWDLSVKFGIPFDELLEENGLTESSSLSVGKVLTIPVHHVPVKSTPASYYGEYLDWWTEAQYVIPIGATFTVTDFATGKTFRAKRTIGSSHADCEPLTASDTAAMKEIWGGSLNWNKRSVIVSYNGRKIAASATSAMHAGNDYDAGGVWTSWRSGDYGSGINYDYVKGNDAHGHFDLYFANSTRHKDGATDSAHEAKVREAAGM
ncbi:MAG: LysM peptidoglycan-binding domain-containing protein [Clostridia bacterium]|nr:LysM peptidoglycan-binding domain-containing protein [Clostridia bacterium]